MTPPPASSVVVTGGGSGIGQATAVLLVGRGADVTIADVNEKGMEETIARADGLPGRIQSIRADVMIEEDVIRMVEHCVSTFGRLDAACNAAGVMNLSLPIHKISHEAWQRSVGINLTGVFLCMKHEIIKMLQIGAGSIVNLSSTAAVKGYPGSAEYSAAKAGMLALARVAVQDYGKLGIRVNTILPGATLTPMFLGSMTAMDGMEEQLAAASPIGRFGLPAEIGEAIIWLLSPASSYVTGAAIPVDGGQSA